MDTDGSISKDTRVNHKATATVRFTSTSYQLILDVKEVLGSLGYVSTIHTDNRINKYTAQVCYDLSINISNKEKYKLFNLKRKKAIAMSVFDVKQQRNYSRTSIREIVDLGYEEEMTCFYVDNDEHLFLTKDFVVTHNTACLVARISQLLDAGTPPGLIVCFSFTN
jgi:hypothetical protein